MTEWLAAALSKHFVVTFFCQSLHAKCCTHRQWQQHIASQSMSYILSLWFLHGQRRRMSIQQISPLIFDKEWGRSLQLSVRVMCDVTKQQWSHSREDETVLEMYLYKMLVFFTMSDNVSECINNNKLHIPLMWNNILISSLSSLSRSTMLPNVILPNFHLTKYPFWPEVPILTCWRWPTVCTFLEHSSGTLTFFWG